MLVFMLDLWFKNLQLNCDFVGLELAMQVAIEYDCEIFMLLMLTIYNNLTLTSINFESVGFVTLERGVFGALAFTKEATLGLLKVELSLFKKTIMFAITFNPFTLWAKHE
jgi:hypothetical protein